MHNLPRKLGECAKWDSGASEVTFEKLCSALLKRHWSRPGLEQFGKKGERQFGVDIFDARARPRCTAHNAS